MQQLEDLHVLHLSKSRVKSLDPSLRGHLGVFHLETCQRWLWISSSEASIEPLLGAEGMEVQRGLKAYLFLLRLATGLESEVLGETDIFGQIKTGWREVELSQRSLASVLAPWIQRVFEDTKEIRTRYLQNLGGASYGTLVRKLLKGQQSVLEGPVLLVGAGQIAQSISPFLLDSELWLWNRASSRLTSLYQDLSARPRGSRVRKLETLEEEAQAWKQAAHVVICIPVDSERDPQRIEWFLQGGSEKRAVIHLGAMKEQCGAWRSLPKLYCLNDLFTLQNSLGNVRSVQIAQAEKACEERAKLRALGASLSICHGWEDLACFA